MSEETFNKLRDMFYQEMDKLGIPKHQPMSVQQQWNLSLALSKRLKKGELSGIEVEHIGT